MSKVSALIQTVRSKAKRLSLSMMGTFAIAGANFLLSLMLIPVMEPRQYGFFTFGLIITQFSYSIVNAMGGTSLSIVLNRGTDDWQAEYSAIMKVNFLVAVLAGLVAAGSAVAFDMPLAVICFMGLFSFSAALRWSYRCAEFARQRLQTTAASDLIYAGFVVIGSVTTHFLHSDKTLIFASATVAAAGLASCAYLFLDSRKTASGVRGRLSDYLPIWRTQARWALVGVATTEMTSNGHSYLVTLMAGPQAFAPIAVATMLWRPLTVVFPALMLVERPVMARHLANGDVAMARKTTSSFLRIVLTILVANLMLVLLLGLIFHEKVANLPYDPRNLYLAGSLWFVVIFMQSLRIPASSLVQAAGKFKPLANTSIVAAPVTMVLAAAIIYFINPVASIVGIIAGEIVMTFLVYRLTRKDEMLR